MRKHEMTQEQLQERQTVIKKLSEHGWQGPLRAEAFERGKLCIPEANMNYNNSTMNLEVSYSAEYKYILISLWNNFGFGIDFVVYFQDKLNKILDIIIMWQDKISKDNYQDYVRQILKDFYNNVYVDKDGEYVQLFDPQKEEK